MASSPEETASSEAIEPLIERARVLAEALPYIQRFDNKTVVVKYGGHAMIDPELKDNVIHDLVLMESVGMRVVVVHGGGPEITRVMKKMKMKAKFMNGQRVTDEETLSVTEMVLDGKINGDIVNAINLAGGRAVGLSGKDARLILAKRYRPTGPDGQPLGDIGFVGEVEKINPEFLHTLYQNEFIPVISPIGVDAEGQTLNINADTVAAETAIALKAAKLILLTDVRGILRDPAAPSTVIPSLPAAECQKMLAEGVISGGMIPKVNACLHALEGGVEKTHVIDGRIAHALLLELFTDRGIGTQIVP